MHHGTPVLQCAVSYFYLIHKVKFHKVLPRTPAQILNLCTCSSISKQTDNADHWGLLGNTNPSKKISPKQNNEEISTVEIYKAYKRTKSQDYQTPPWINYCMANTQDSRWVAAMYLTFKGIFFPEECGLSHLTVGYEWTTGIHHQFMTEAQLAGVSKQTNKK